MKNKWIYIPIIISVAMSLFYVLVIPGKIKSDAAEYDGLANSILVGQYSLNGVPSMEREPGYPLFRSIVKIFTVNPDIILFVQVLLYCLTIYIVGLVCSEIDPILGNWGLWGASLSYALAFYPSTHISETFVAFLLAIFALTLIKSTKNPRTRDWVFLSIISAFIILTRYPYLLVPVSFIAILYFYSIKKGEKSISILRKIFLSLLILFSLVSPWLLRNYMVFNEINIAGRSGAGFYARAWKAEKSWRSLGDSYLSAILGRGILFTIYPNNQSIWLDQWGDWWRNEETVKKMWGEGLANIDNNRKLAAKEIIFKNINNFSKFVVWSGVDTIRLLQLQNPIPTAYGSPFEGTYGELAKQKNINNIQLLGLALVHLLQLVWFIAIIISTYLGFKKYGLRYIPGIFLVCILTVHSVADNIARYGAPLQPWLLSGIFMTIIFPVYTKYRDLLNPRK